MHQLKGTPLLLHVVDGCAAISHLTEVHGVVIRQPRLLSGMYGVRHLHTLLCSLPLTLTTSRFRQRQAMRGLKKTLSDHLMSLSSTSLFVPNQLPGHRSIIMWFSKQVCVCAWCHWVLTTTCAAAAGCCVYVCDFPSLKNPPPLPGCDQGLLSLSPLSPLSLPSPHPVSLSLSVRPYVEVV